MFFFLDKQPHITSYIFPHAGIAGDLNEQIRKKIKEAAYFIFFWGSDIGDIQADELEMAYEEEVKIIPVRFPNYCEYKPGIRLQLEKLSEKNCIEVNTIVGGSSLRVARVIVSLIENSTEGAAGWIRN